MPHLPVRYERVYVECTRRVLNAHVEFQRTIISGGRLILTLYAIHACAADVAALQDCTPSSVGEIESQLRQIDSARYYNVSSSVYMLPKQIGTRHSCILTRLPVLQACDSRTGATVAILLLHCTYRHAHASRHGLCDKVHSCADVHAPSVDGHAIQALDSWPSACVARGSRNRALADPCLQFPVFGVALRPVCASGHRFC
jgi:hypothetical protein